MDPTYAWSRDWGQKLLERRKRQPERAFSPNQARVVVVMEGVRGWGGQTLTLTAWNSPSCGLRTQRDAPTQEETTRAPKRNLENSPKVANAFPRPLFPSADGAHDSRPFPQRAAAHGVWPERGSPAAGHGIGPGAASAPHSLSPSEGRGGACCCLKPAFNSPPACFRSPGVGFSVCTLLLLQ